MDYVFAVAAIAALPVGGVYLIDHGIDPFMVVRAIAGLVVFIALAWLALCIVIGLLGFLRR